MKRKLADATRAIAALFAFFTCAFALHAPAVANTVAAYPHAGPVSLVVPYPAGGSADASARIFAGPIAESLGQNVVVENIGGASGTIAAKRLLNGKTDGYTIFFGSPSELILPTLVNKAITFKPEDFALIQPISTATIVLLTRSDLGVKTLDDFIRLAQKKDSAPLTYASIGMGSMYHLITDRLAKEMNLNVQHVPYRGAAPALIDLAGGQVDFAVLAFQTSMIGLQNEGRIKILSTLGSKAPEPLKDIPKVTDSKLLKDFDYSISAGYFVKKGTSQQVVEKLRQAVSFALEKKDVREKLEIEGRIVLDPMSTQDNEAFWQQQIKSLRDLVDIVGYEPI
ncbi:tripartite tricarboxylate transporter substrate binding protein [Bordetella sp. BOR01]|uniref:tripartite tricarboxylate transporter substrate binding protein n=1 Tax=Bordetella sp. BOR01 TaxID=2854779 RepID=UPI001C44D53C|nr:tripartite tricarboxylate transporter substrate binding protein [Bordetella sp. BOR01]MBV7483337.1 tripartite tricarboxylate transporter substrate binding protein [Bordetella sp. BOR01]